MLLEGQIQRLSCSYNPLHENLKVNVTCYRFFQQKTKENQLLFHVFLGGKRTGNPNVEPLIWISHLGGCWDLKHCRAVSISNQAMEHDVAGDEDHTHNCRPVVQIIEAIHYSLNRLTDAVSVSHWFHLHLMPTYILISQQGVSIESV